MRGDRALPARFRRYSDSTGICEEFISPVLGGKRTVAVLSRPLEASSTTGWVICHSYGIEQIHLGRLDVVVARALAAAGFPVLRFHGQGYGDSEGRIADLGVASHVADGRDAVALLKTVDGIEQVGVAGARFGGTVAALVANEMELPAMALFEPIVSGAHYAREVLRRKVLSEMVGRSNAAEAGVQVSHLRQELMERGVVDVNGFSLSLASYEDLMRLDLTADLDMFRGRALLLGVSRSGKPGPGLTKLSESLASSTDRCSTDVIQDQYAGDLGKFHFRTDRRTGARIDTLDPVSGDIASRMVRWASEGDSPARPAERPPSAVDGSSLPWGARVGEAIELPLFVPYGQEHLAAVLTVPDGGAKGLVVLLMGIGAPRSHRFQVWTKLARELAVHGLASIRFDYLGMGDSTGASLEWGPGWEDRLFPQVEAAVRFGMDTLEVDRVGAVGNCGGADLSLRLTADMPEAIAAYCINLPALEWNTLTGVQRRARTSKAAFVFRSSRLLRWAIRPFRHRRPESRIHPRHSQRLSGTLDHARVFVLYGEKDIEYSPRVGAELRRIVQRYPVEQRDRFAMNVLDGVEVGGFESVAIQDHVIAAAVTWTGSAFSERSTADSTGVIPVRAGEARR
jgi:pimeloyl-ACP methyl ester carboxylesterase